MENSNETPTTSAAVAEAASATEIATATKCGAYKIITFFLNVNMRKATLFFLARSEFILLLVGACSVPSCRLFLFTHVHIVVIVQQRERARCGYVYVWCVCAKVYT